jgi:hypothetical protein
MQDTVTKQSGLTPFTKHTGLFTQLDAVAAHAPNPTDRQAAGELATRIRLRFARSVRKDVYTDEVAQAQALVEAMDLARGTGPEYTRGVLDTAAAVDAAQGTATAPFRPPHDVRSQLQQITAGQESTLKPAAEQAQLDYNDAVADLEKAARRLQNAPTVLERESASAEVTRAQLRLGHLTGVI